MQKWEYGFLKLGKPVVEKRGWSTDKGYQEALFNGKPIVKTDLNQTRDLLLIAINTLGGQGWELVTYTVVLLPIPGDSVGHLSETIVFKRPIE